MNIITLEYICYNVLKIPLFSYSAAFLLQKPSASSVIPDIMLILFGMFFHYFLNESIYIIPFPSKQFDMYT